MSLSAALREGQALLDYDFARGIYRLRGVSQSSATGLAVTQAGSLFGETLAGALTQFAADLPRITNRGLRLETAATNRLAQSQTFDNVAWAAAIGGTGLTPVVTANAAVAPDGTTTADQIVFNLAAGTTNGDVSMLSMPVSGLVAAAPYIGGLYLRAASPCNLLIRHAGGGGYTTVAVTTAWQRLSAQENAFGTASDFQFGLRSGVFGSLGSATVFAWGGQLEAGSASSSYIPTTTAPVVRAADVATLTATGVKAVRLFTEVGIFNIAGAAATDLAPAAAPWLGSYVQRIEARG